MTLARRAALNTLALLGGQAINAIGGLVAVAVTTRYLGITRYGDFIIATTFFSLTQLVSEFGIGPVATRQLSRYPERESELLGSIAILATALAALGAVGAIAASFLAYPGSDQAVIRGAIAILTTQLLCAGPRSAAAATINAQQRAYLASASGVITRVVTLAAVLAVAGFDLGFAAMVVAYTATTFVQTAALVVFARRALRHATRSSPAEVRSLFRQVAPMAGVSIIDFLYFRLDLILLSLLSGPVDVARYGIAYKIIEILQQLPSFVMITLMPELARQAADSQQFRRLLQQALNVMQLLAVPVLLLGVFAEQLLTVIGGPGFRPAAGPLRLMLLALALAYLQTVLGHALVAQGRQRLALRVSIQVLVLNLVLNLALIPWLGILGAAIALVVSELASLVLMWRRFGETGATPRVRLTAAYAAASVAMLAAFLAARWAGDRLGLGDAPLLLAGGALGGLCYVGVLAAMGGLPRELMKEIARLRPRRSSS